MEMKESFLYQRGQGNTPKVKDTQKSERNSVISTYHAASRNQLLEGVLKIMEFIILKEERIQVLKELLTSRSDFNPDALYSYISRDEQQIDKRHFMFLLDQNHIQTTEQEVKLYLNSYGFKERLDYSAFINLIFPVDPDLLKYISVTGIKKYSNHSLVTEQVLCIFVMLLHEEIKMLVELQEVKSGLMPRISRKEIKTIMRTMKKNGQCNSQMDIQSQSFVKYEELKTLFKNLTTKDTKNLTTKDTKNLTTKDAKNMSIRKGRKGSEVKQEGSSDIYSLLERNSGCVFRKLSMGKCNFINLEDFEFWLKPWNRLKLVGGNMDEYCAFSNVFELSGINQIAHNESNISLQNSKVPLSHIYA